MVQKEWPYSFILFFSSSLSSSVGIEIDNHILLIFFSRTSFLSCTVRPVVVISPSPEKVSLAVGASITLTCKAEPRAIDRGYIDRWVKYIQWYNPNGTEVGAKCQQPSSIFAYKRKFSCPLVFKNLTEDEFGHYICQAGNHYSKHCTRQSFAIGKYFIIARLSVFFYSFLFVCVTLYTPRPCLGKVNIAHWVSLDGKCIFISRLVFKMRDA